jgi:hypothetical protein
MRLSARLIGVVGLLIAASLALHASHYLATARPAFLSHDPAELTRLLVDESPRSKRGIPVIEA